MSELLETALQYASVGIPVFPLRPRSKFPYAGENAPRGPHICPSGFQHQHGHLDASRDPVVLAAWWKEHPLANIGMPTGRGIDVLDVDGAEGEDALSKLIAKRWPFPETTEVRTGRPGGGRQLDFLSAGWPNTVGKRGGLAPGLDTRGLGGFVLRPPSVHPTGVIYSFTKFVKPAPAPAWLTQLLFRPKEPVVPFVPRKRADDDAAIEQAARALAEMPAAISGQGGQRDLWDAARTMRGFDLSESEVLELLISEYNPRCVPPWSMGELRHTVRGAFTRARKIPEPPREQRQS